MCAPPWRKCRPFIRIRGAVTGWTIERTRCPDDPPPRDVALERLPEHQRARLRLLPVPHAPPLPDAPGGGKRRSTVGAPRVSFGSYVLPPLESVAPSVERPAGHHGTGVSVALVRVSSRGAPASLDTGAVTQRVRPGDRNNSTEERLRVLASAPTEAPSRWPALVRSGNWCRPSGGGCG